MNLTNYRKLFLFLFVFLFFSACSTNEPSRYNQLDFFDLVGSKENNIHSNRVSVLNSKIDNTKISINFYKNKIRLTKQAINNLKIEVSSYNSLINNVSNDIRTVKQLDRFLDKLDIQIKNVELEFIKVQNISKGLEKISKTNFLALKQKGYFSNLNWLDYLEVVEEVIEYKKEIDSHIQISKKGIKYTQIHSKKILGKIVKWGVKKVLRKLIPPLAIIDGIEMVVSVGKWFYNLF